MTALKDFAQTVRAFLLEQPHVRAVTVYGSLENGTSDAYSDIDLSVDVSGADNGAFALQLPALMATRFDVLFFDFAPSLAPEKYVVTIAVDRENPFRLIDLCCTATPHYGSVSKEELMARNDRYVHMLKLFSANLKHHLRGAVCQTDIEKMYRKVFGSDAPAADEKAALCAVYDWLAARAGETYGAYVALFEQYME